MDAESLTSMGAMKVWLVFSIEYGLWLAPDGKGYTPRRDAAGRYTEEEAEEICRGEAAKDGGGLPNEIALVAPEVVEQLSDALKKLADIEEYGTGEINAAGELRQELARVKFECDTAREHLCELGLLPAAYPTLQSAVDGIRGIVSFLRNEMKDPPAHIQEAVLAKLGVNERTRLLAESSDRWRALAEKLIGLSGDHDGRATLREEFDALLTAEPRD